MICEAPASLGTARSGGLTGPFLLPSTKIRSSSPGGSVNSSDASSSSGASSCKPCTSRCAISTPALSRSSKSTDCGAAGSGRCGGDCRIWSARVSNSSGDSPVENALGCSARRESALNTSPHRPQRTCPPAARSTSADSLKTVSHFAHCVYKLGRSPGVNAAPVIPPNDLHDIKSRGVGGLYRVCLRLQQTRQQQVGAILTRRRQDRRQFDQGPGQDIRDHTVCRPQR